MRSAAIDAANIDPEDGWPTVNNLLPGLVPLDRSRTDGSYHEWLIKAEQSINAIPPKVRRWIYNETQIQAVIQGLKEGKPRRWWQGIERHVLIPYGGEKYNRPTLPPGISSSIPQPGKCLELSHGARFSPAETLKSSK